MSGAAPPAPASSGRTSASRSRTAAKDAASMHATSTVSAAGTTSTTPAGDILRRPPAQEAGSAPRSSIRTARGPIGKTRTASPDEAVDADAGVGERGPDSARQCDRAGCVTVDADRACVDLDDTAVEGGDGVFGCDRDGACCHY